MEPDRYEVLDVIGSGGMATVWRARDTRLGRLVAIKRPSSAFDDPVWAARFGREARAAATVSHPHVVAIYDTGVDELGPYLVMELVDGPSLATARVAVDRVAEIGSQVASALAALHAAGVVHGDVKPGNILLGADGAKLTDFGIARGVDDTVTLHARLAFGTPAYAAPENLAHGERNAAGDVYTLASTLHELLTGSRWSASIGSTQAMPPGRWSTILAPALAPDPADRPTAAAFAASLESLHDQRGAATTPMHVGAPAGGGATRRPPTGDVTSARRTAATAAVGGAAVLLVVIAVALRDGDGVGGGDTATSTPSSVASAGPTLPPPESTATSTAAPAAPPTAPTTPTTPPTTPATSAAPVGLRTTSQVAAELIRLIEGVPPKELKPKDSRELVERIDDVVDVAADDPSGTEATLRKAAEQARRRLGEGTIGDRAEALLIELAETLGLAATAVTGE